MTVCVSTFRGWAWGNPQNKLASVEQTARMPRITALPAQGNICCVFRANIQTDFWRTCFAGDSVWAAQQFTLGVDRRGRAGGEEWKSRGSHLQLLVTRGHHPSRIDSKWMNGFWEMQLVLYSVWDRNWKRWDTCLTKLKKVRHMSRPAETHVSPSWTRWDIHQAEKVIETLATRTRRLRGDQIEVFKILNGYDNIDSNIFFSKLSKVK